MILLNNEFYFIPNIYLHETFRRLVKYTREIVPGAIHFFLARWYFTIICLNDAPYVICLNNAPLCYYKAISLPPR